MSKWTDTDIVDRIRIWKDDSMIRDLMEDASDEIIRLRTEVEALRLLVNTSTSQFPEWFRKAKQ